jgi:hypothetical protein
MQSKANKKDAQEMPMRVINHKTMRIIIGTIALQMPIVVWILSGHKELSSISISYWTDTRDIFVGSLVAVAFFLSAYNGSGECKRDIEYYLSKLACIFAILVALFPTKDFSECTDCAPNWVVHISDIVFLKPHQVHNAAAILLFICLILLMAFFSLRARNKGKLSRSRFYRVISLGMLMGMPLIYVLGELSSLYEPVFAVEFWGLLLFGVGWIRAGWYKSEPEEGLPVGATLLTEVEVDPRNKHVPTSIDVEAGGRYFFTAKGCWCDWFLECGPHGWGPDWNPLSRRNRVTRKSLFLLCGNVGQNDEYAFPIGGRCTWTVPTEVDALAQDERKLYLFANDWESMYRNNKQLEPKEGGPLKVSIYRLPG